MWVEVPLDEDPIGYDSHDHADCSETVLARGAVVAAVGGDAGEAAEVAEVPEVAEVGASLIETLNDWGSVTASAVGCR